MAVIDITSPPFDERLEQSVLGACLMTTAAARAVVEIGVRPEMFYRDKHRRLMTAVCELLQAGGGIDLVTVAAHLDADDTLRHEMNGVAACVPAIGAIRTHAQQFMRIAELRRLLIGSYNLQTAIHDRDDTRIADALHELVVEVPEDRRRSYDPEQAAAAMIESFGAKPVERFPWPYQRLNELSGGGARRGHVTVITGATSFGKSVIVDECLESMAGPGRRVQLYLNEMTVPERMERVAARRASVELDVIQQAAAGLRTFTPDQERRVVTGIADQPIGFTECDGWTAEQICTHARRRQFDVVAFDIVNRLPFSNTNRLRDMEEASNQFDRLAKSGCHVILAAHINRERVKQTGKFPKPTLSDLRDNAGFANDPDNVIGLWREQDDETYDPLPAGLIRFLKCRGGKRGGCEVTFQGEFQRFRPTLQVAA